MALILSRFMSKTMLQLSSFKPYQQPRKGIMKLGKPPPRPPVEGGRGSQTHGVKKMKASLSSSKNTVKDSTLLEKNPGKDEASAEK